MEKETESQKAIFKDWNSFEMQFKKQCVCPSKGKHTSIAHVYTEKKASLLTVKTC